MQVEKILRVRVNPRRNPERADNIIWLNHYQPDGRLMASIPVAHAVSVIIDDVTPVIDEKLCARIAAGELDFKPFAFIEGNLRQWCGDYHEYTGQEDQECLERLRCANIFNREAQITASLSAATRLEFNPRLSSGFFVNQDGHRETFRHARTALHHHWCCAVINPETVVNTLDRPLTSKPWSDDITRAGMLCREKTKEQFAALDLRF